MKFCLTVCFAGILTWSTGNCQFNPQWGSRFQTVLDSTVSANNIKGASVAVHFPEKGTWNGVSGISSAGNNITSDMRFGIGSNTK